MNKFTKEEIFAILYELRLAPRHQLEEAAEKIVEASANKAEVEPVAWMTPSDWKKEPLATTDVSVANAWRRDNREVTPLFATPPANKAEVVPLAVDREAVRDAVADSMTGLYHCGRVWSAWGYGTMSESDFSLAADDEDILDNITDAVIAAIGKVATPPATTGASTALRPTDDDLWDATLRDRDAYHEWADKLADAIAKHFGVDIGEHSNQNLPWAEALEAIENAEPVGASTVLTDERISEIASAVPCKFWHAEWFTLFARAIEREVAAQEGQVVIPDVIYEAIGAAFEDRKGWRTKIAAAVRALPAKESK